MPSAYTNADLVAAQLVGVGVKTAVKAQLVVRHTAMLLQTKVQAKASGRPGPRAITGDYRRSWTTDISSSGGNVEATVGTNKPQARRLEFGFVGADSLGRVYNQPPFPHVGPATAEIEPVFHAAMSQVVGF